MTIDLLTEQVAKQLIDAAKTKMLVTEEELCRKLNASRTSIRGSLEHLEKQGMVERRKKKGTFLRKPSIKEWIELWDFRTGIEGFAARLACANATEADLAELETIIQDRLRAGENKDDETANRLDIVFHSRIVELSGNSYLKKAVENLQLFEQISKIYYFAPPSFSAVRDKDYVGHHEKIVEALRNRNPDQAEQMMRLHIQGAKKRIIEFVLGKVDLFE
jgi:DNA-binding GntR family transcriptional regulator